MDAELRHHIACETDARIEQGMAPEAARRAALRDFGGLERIKEEGRDARGARGIEDLAADLRYATRLLGRHRGFSVAAILTFALGIGAATAIFSVVYGVVLRPLPYAQPDQLLAVWERDVPRNIDRNVVSVENFEAWRERSAGFQGMAALVPRSFTLANGASPERVVGAEVSTGYFQLLGVTPALGRAFDANDGRDGAAMILSDGYWRRRFGADPAIIGTALTISGKPFSVVGVMPADFDPPRFGWLAQQEVWFPFVATAENRAWGRFLLVIGRLRSGVSADQAQSELATIAARRATESPGNRGWSVSVVPLSRQITGDVSVALFALLAAVALLLVIAVTNVATLTLSTMRGRGQELAIRRAVGATDRRLFRQLLSQSALLGAIGTAVGLSVAAPVVHLLLVWLPPEVPRSASIRVDAPVLLVTMLTAVAATLLFGSVAARRGGESSIVSPAKETGDGRSSGQAGGGALVVLEIAVALALSVMAVLMSRSFVELRKTHLGFTPDGVVMARVALPGDRYTSPQSQRQFFVRLLERVRAVPGVTAAGVISTRPFGGLGPATTVTDPRAGATAVLPSVVADVRYADAAVFEALRVPLKSGRMFDSREEAPVPPRVIISDSLAHAVWPGDNGKIVGRELAIDMFNGITPEVIGVVGDVQLMDPRTPPRAVAYLSAAQFPSTVRDLIVRTGGAPGALVPALRSALTAVDPSLPLYLVTTLPQLVDASLAADRFTTLLLAAFAVAALLLASVGIFGVFSGEVTRRRKEIGIRMALGARGFAIITLLLGEALRRAAFGVVYGTLLAALLGRGMKALLFGVSAFDPISILLVAIGVLTLALMATLIPAMHAVRISPLTALREG